MLRFIFIGFLLVSCSDGWKSGYHVENGSVVHFSGFPAQKKVVSKADADSFESLNNDYGKDKNHVFLRTDVIPAADPASFVLLGGVFSKDKRHGYIGSTLVTDDAAHFEIIANPNETPHNVTAEGIVYARDSQRVYTYSNEVLDGADPASFRFVPMFNGYYLAHDKRYVYFRHRPLEQVDGGSFMKLSDLYFKDKKAVWVLSMGQNTKWIPLPNADLATFKPLKKWYAKDKNHVYYQEQQVPGADPATFEENDSLGGKDNYHIYQGTQIK